MRGAPLPSVAGINLDVYKGEFLAIYGTSGGGKTSLLNILGVGPFPAGEGKRKGTRWLSSRTAWLEERKSQFRGGWQPSPKTFRQS